MNPPANRARSRPLLPTLFDRLRDDAPSVLSESPAAYSVSAAQLRVIVQRDLAFLLNATNIEDLIDPRQHAAAASSSVNFGLPPMAGGHVSDRRWADIELGIRRAIERYEPRLLPASVSVSPVEAPRAGRTGAGIHETGHVLMFEIRALIDARPYPLSLTVQSAVDLENSRVHMKHAALSD